MCVCVCVCVKLGLSHRYTQTEDVEQGPEESTMAREGGNDRRLEYAA